ncbi:hypothetical protein [Thomasclavelia ramosa]|uniref:hypothetical protein n=1 Tax=Thomasclavelia ramosa TaxID=1547 RepID=UPI0031B5F91A
MNRLFYTIFSNIDIFKVIKNTFIFISECVAMNLLFLGLACFANPEIIDKNLLTELSFKNSYALYLFIIILYEGSRNFISYAFFDRKITYIRGSTIEHMKKVKELCIGFNCEVKVLTGDSDYKVRLLGIILMVLVCLAVLFCTCVIILIMYGYLYFMLGILLY